MVAEALPNDTLLLIKTFSAIAGEAFNMSKSAEQVLINSKVSLANASATINSTYPQEMEAYKEVVETHQDATELRSDVLEPENLLKDYIKQREELEALTKQIYQLELDLDKILGVFQTAEDTYKCDVTP